MNFIKILGLILIFVTSAFLGILKSRMLVKRSKALEEVHISLDRLAEFIKCGTGDLGKLLHLSFGEKIKECKTGYRLTDEGLLAEDKELFARMLGEMGISHREREEKTVLLYSSIFEKRQAEAEERSKQLAKLYNSLGFLIGASICIFLI